MFKGAVEVFPPHSMVVQLSSFILHKRTIWTICYLFLFTPLSEDGNSDCHHISKMDRWDPSTNDWPSLHNPIRYLKDTSQVPAKSSYWVPLANTLFQASCIKTRSNPTYLRWQEGINLLPAKDKTFNIFSKAICLFCKKNKGISHINIETIKLGLQLHQDLLWRSHSRATWFLGFIQLELKHHQ